MSEPNPFLRNLVDIYWGSDKQSITDQRRMQAVVLEISRLLKTWAPEEGQARICFMAINETADKLARMAEISE